ncbi:MAG: phosphatidate cytidylyltransferase [Gammaproteobacteria bacterium]|nr:phosphatidate cytidylyltransferase [Gammaproteobacteria bacterium]
MFKRLLTAVLLIPLVVGGVLLLPTAMLFTLGALLLGLAAWEWTGLVPLRPTVVRLVYGLLLMALLVLGGFALQRQPALLQPSLMVALGWWLLAALWLGRPQLGRDRVVAKALLALPVLLPAGWALAALHARPEHGPALALFVLVLMWVADSGAYFAGRNFGRHKLAPRVSPNKTWEGVAGGLAGSLLFALLAGGWFGWTGGRLTGFVVLAVLCALLSVVGDLFISLLKRQQGLKDTGNLFPGHGGLLDRIDSLLAAAPLFALGLDWVE